MNPLIELWAWLNGKKTYIIGLTGLVYGVSAIATHHLTLDQAWPGIEFSLGVLGLRHGVTTSLSKIEPFIANYLANQQLPAPTPVTPPAPPA